MKSDPATEIMAAGNPYAQYVAMGLITAKRRHAIPVNKVPKTISVTFFVRFLKPRNETRAENEPIIRAKSTWLITKAMMRLQMIPLIIIGSVRKAPRIGESSK